LPFEKLVEELQPNRSLNHSPIFQVVFHLQNAFIDTLKLSGVTMDKLEVANKTAKFDLSLTVAETQEGLAGVLNYNTDLFGAAMIGRMLGHFQRLLEAAVANPDERVSRLPLLTDAEISKALLEWNDTKMDFVRGGLIHEMVEEQAKRGPEALAVISKQGKLTYRELDRRANQLANYLQECGVGPESLVGVCVERSLEMIISLLAILKAGGAYLPLDAEYPEQRLRFMLEDARVSILLTQKKLAIKLPAYDGQTIQVDADWQSIAERPSDRPYSTVADGNLAYVLYTSGSTGKPKGVMISHQALRNHMLWMRSAFPLAESDRVLQKTPFIFDASVWEFYAPLMAGATLVMAAPGGHQDAEYLIDAIAEYQITTLQLVPTLVRVLLEADIGRCKSLRRVFIGGETLTTELVQRLKARLGVEVYNLYGPTETTIDVTYEWCEGTRERQAEIIGRPISNMQVYVLDHNLALVPAGVAGEICISGAGLARGYLNRADLTAEKFMPIPYGREAGARLYRTGDIGRYLLDGRVDYLGRADDQEKMHGYRIELGEIESVIRESEGIKECAAAVKEDEDGNKRLVAYVAREPGSSISISELRSHVAKKLPEYMVPSAYMILDELPLTPSGKINRPALPEPGRARRGQESTFISPRNVIEEVLAGIFSEVLKVEPVGVHDNFFNLGGHSILATQLVSRLRKTFQVSLPLRQFFESPTVAAISQTLVAGEIKPGQTERVATLIKKVENLSTEDLEELVGEKGEASKGTHPSR
jgi:amino acid adenylation domain-containing protein